MAKFTKASFNRELAEYGFELVRGPEGYFYWAHLEGVASMDAVADAESIYVYKFDDMTQTQWRAAAEVIVEGIIAKRRV